MSQTGVKVKAVKALPVNRHHRGDTVPFLAFDLNKVTAKQLEDKFKVSSAAAKALISARKKPAIRHAADVFPLKEIAFKDFEIIRRCGFGTGDKGFSITDVQPCNGHLFSYKPISLKVSFLNPSGRQLAVVSVKVLWKGEPFIFEKEVSGEDLKQGYITVNFDENQTLPPGPTRFITDLFDAEGGQSTFKVTCVVLPSNPLSLSVSPSTYYVTGSYSLRGHYDSGADNFVTVVRISVYNGDGASVNMSKDIKWEFWDGGVGGSLVESNTHHLSSNFTIAAYNSWSIDLYFTSPHGSGIYNKYHGKEDMTVKIEMKKTSGAAVSDTITARVMLAFGVDVIRVASDTFVGQEYTDLYDAVDVTKSIYEARDITIRDIGRYHITDSAAGSYKYMNSEDECHDLFEDWTAYDAEGVNIDVFTAHDFIGVGFDGLAGGIPGSLSDSGRSSGVAVDKTGYVDGTGTKRLSVDYLGMLIGHEVGHFLGLPHISENGNLMLASSGTTDTNLNYDQYRIIMGYGRVFIF